MKRLIIITTALCRPEIHDISLAGIGRIFQNLDREIKWLVNIDKISVTEATQEETGKNLRKLLVGFDVTYFLPEAPCFFSAVERLVIESEKYLHEEDSAVFWLEDDWEINKPFLLKDIMDKYLSPTGFISLNYNSLGSFPPAIWGKTLYEKYLLPGFKQCKEKRMNPEIFSRNHVREKTHNDNLIHRYFLVDYPEMEINNHTLLSRSLLTTRQPESYETDEFYFVVSGRHNRKILGQAMAEIKKKHRGKSIKTCDERDLPALLKSNEEKYIDIIRFDKNVNCSLHGYDGKHFRDIGRAWGKKHGLNHADLMAGKILCY